MDLSTAMRFVMMRAQAEAASLNHEEVFPEHILLGILKFAECTAEEISPSSRSKKETDEDITIIKECLKQNKVVSYTARETLRRMLRSQKPEGDSDVISVELLETAKKLASSSKVYPSHVLLVMLVNPTAMIQSALNLSIRKDSSVVKQSGTSQDENDTASEDSLSFLALLTKRIRDMRYALLGTVRGQDHVVSSFAEGMFSAEVLAAADKERKRPRAIFVFAGPPGVGKTFLAEEAAKSLDIPYKRFDMSAYASQQAEIPLIGFAPSYKDAKEGLLTGFVKKNHKCILLFDEIEKAHLNTIHLFLQILDAGRLHDDFLDEDIEFKDTIIIFTTNAGRQLYEGDNKHNAAGLPRQVILNALETDTHPQTGKAFFPAAICSRLATGWPMMFNHLAAHDLESISRNELQRFCGLFEKQYSISSSFDELLPTVLLFNEGGQTDARTLRARSELLFKNEVFKLCRLWGDNMEIALKKLENIYFSTDTENLPDNVAALFECCDKPEFLVFGDLLFAARLEEALDNMIVHSTCNKEEAFKLLAENDVGFVLLNLVKDKESIYDPLITRLSIDEQVPESGTIAAFDNISIASNSLSIGREFFKALRERMPEMPLYLIESPEFHIDEELMNAFVQSGARGKLTASSSQIDILEEEITQIARYLHLQATAALLSTERKVLSFETAPILSADKTAVTIRLRHFSLRRAKETTYTSFVIKKKKKPNVRFDDVIGARDAKEELQFFIQFLKNPKSFSIKGLRPPKGVLLHGPPGTGKTLLAKAMAGESDVSFIPAVASSFVTKWQGSGPEAVRELFKRARRYAPSIIFIDEIDAIGTARTGGGSGHGEEMALNALLTEMDGFTVDPKRTVFVLAATNFAVDESKSGVGTIDAALARRFDRKILVDLPNKEDRRLYLEYALSKRTGHNVTSEMIERLSGRSAGLSLANLESVIEMAVRTAAKQDEQLNDEMLEDSFELSRHGEEKNWGHEYLERVARHEAGHAYLCFLSGKTPNYLTIVARGGHGGYMEHADTEDSMLKTRDELLARIRTSLGGRAAELVYYGSEDGLSTGASGDLDYATNIARAMLINYGMDFEFGLATISQGEVRNGVLAMEIQTKINETLKFQMEQTVSVIKKSKEKIDILVKALFEKNKLTREEIEVLLM
ncbi:MAG: AAA family ATPase [Oscillospiraceae bacterium]|jgi:ATP-dependent metalloprotease FtsH|nr:AAA family ATPase [Oscillospiraceae bacterium]